MNTPIHIIIQWIHVLVIAPLFIYIALRRTKVKQIVYPITLIIGLVVILYHGYKITKNPRWGHIYLLHILVIAPSLLAVGYYKEKTNYMVYDYLLLLGCAALGYNLLKLYPTYYPSTN
jgi:hypothetical protein